MYITRRGRYRLFREDEVEVSNRRTQHFLIEKIATSHEPLPQVKEFADPPQWFDEADHQIKIYKNIQNMNYGNWIYGGTPIV